ncbi:MAG TPA: C25 family cysteine peptidase [Chitinophagales bacterium]|nr:C25 family cysteine peptidase [Chitinophagales bacterium]HNL84501.1 C25 family cysteine peptidase [Chitinophagales bacterium]
MKYDKVILTNKTALDLKYKTDSKFIIAALNKLVQADATKNLKSKLILLDDKTTMNAINVNRVRQFNDAEQVKIAIDGIYSKLSPDYILLVGGTEIIPHVRLTNPCYDPNDDIDRFIYSDLPYACNTAYSTSASAFTSPVRVVGRIPDITGIKNPDNLIKLIQNSINNIPRKKTVYDSIFGLSAKIWEKSTNLSLSNITGSPTPAKTCPPFNHTTASHGDAELGSMMHFINCHGAGNTPEFYGQRDRTDGSFPVSFITTDVVNKITYAAMVAVECCYGAQLYYASTANEIPICNNYLLHGALAYVGSTNIAYGPAVGNGLADLITQYFLRKAKEGASIGRAFLEARLDFLEDAQPDLDAEELKTLAQFVLYGDPSVCLVEEQVSPDSDSFAPKTQKTIEQNQRKNRRYRLMEKGLQLGISIGIPKKTNKPKSASASALLRTAINTALKENNFEKSNAKVYIIKKPTHSAGKSASRKVEFHTYSKTKKVGKVINIEKLVLKVVNSDIVGIRKYVSK